MSLKSIESIIRIYKRWYKKTITKILDEKRKYRLRGIIIVYSPCTVSSDGVFNGMPHTRRKFHLTDKGQAGDGLISHPDAESLLCHSTRFQ